MLNYFEFYGLPLRFNPDRSVLKQQFYALSKKYHPDFFINESAERQEEVLELSTINNKAYQVLSDSRKLLPYVLELKGYLTEGEHYVLPQVFLMEMMEINEALMELEFEPDVGKLQALSEEVMKIEDGISGEMQLLMTEFDRLEDNAPEDLLVSIKDLYYRGKYLIRIKDNISRLVSAKAL